MRTFASAVLSGNLLRFRKRRKKDDDKAFYNLGLCYEFGEGVTQSARWAIHYYAKASKLGHQKAAIKLKQM